ncbi:Prohibitin-1, mitochondrial [Vitis vinifera]|uniref:Prohibitin-1, mitochondrial n=1 Tax=Vitis vinifera TaxID=29760 RepID=A0A438IB48_VITVI|nr:Prohibitin-1, mitochondrial [Vitis vinifera]
MNFNNIKAPKVPGGGAASALIKLGVVGGLGLYGAINSLYNVEGGHRAIVFNRIVGVKDKADLFCMYVASRMCILDDFVTYIIGQFFIASSYVLPLKRNVKLASILFHESSLNLEISALLRWTDHCVGRAVRVLRHPLIGHGWVGEWDMQVYPEGTHLMIPWFDRPVIYDVRTRPHLVESTSGSHDLQMVKIGLRVLTRPLPDQLPTIYRTLGENYNERVLPSIIHETLKAVVAQYNASQLITQREKFSVDLFCPSPVIKLMNSIINHMSTSHPESGSCFLYFSMTVSREIRKLLTERAANFNIALDDVSITSLTFGREFTAAIEAKQVAAQEAERAKFVVEKAEQDKRSAIIRAQCCSELGFSTIMGMFPVLIVFPGEAKSAQLIGQAIANNPAFITLRKIEASREIAHTISNSANKQFVIFESRVVGGQSIAVCSFVLDNCIAFTLYEKKLEVFWGMILCLLGLRLRSEKQGIG